MTIVLCVCLTTDGKMKLVALSVILSCCLVHVYSDCGAPQRSTVRQQFTAAVGNDDARLQQFAQQYYQRSVPLTQSHYEKCIFLGLLCSVFGPWGSRIAIKTLIYVRALAMLCTGHTYFTHNVYFFLFFSAECLYSFLKYKY